MFKFFFIEADWNYISLNETNCFTLEESYLAKLDGQGPIQLAFYPNTVTSGLFMQHMIYSPNLYTALCSGFSQNIFIPTLLMIKVPMHFSILFPLSNITTFTS